MPQIHIRPANGTWTIRAGDIVIARSARVLELTEGSYPPVLYVPRKDADMSVLDHSARTTQCPHKGTASYFSIRAASGPIPDAVWSYEAPKGGVADIAGHLAFYPAHVTMERS